jgi:hypothetical protein
MVKLFLKSRRTGLYLAVTREGDVGAGDKITVVESDPNACSVSLIFRLFGQVIPHVNATPDEIEKGLVAAGISQFAARSVRELDEETSRGYQAIVTPTVTNLTGRVPMSVEDFLQTTVPALVE